MNTEEINGKLRSLKENILTMQGQINALELEIKVGKFDEALKQTPKVGDWVLGNKGAIGRIMGKLEEHFTMFGNDNTGEWEINFVAMSGIKRILTESEVIDFLSKEAEKMYKDANKINSFLVDEIDFPFSEITCIIGKYFKYKGVLVLDLNTGEWAEVVEKKEEDWDVEIVPSGGIVFSQKAWDNEVGKYKLVKI